MNTLDDEQLVALVARRNQAALAELYDRHAGWLSVRLRRRCPDATVVEEVLQDTFLSVWRSADGFTAGSVGAWVWTLASRRLVDALRVGARRPPVVEARKNDAATPGPEELVVTDLRHGELAGALDRLSPELRAVLQATVLDGLTTREAAVVLGIPTGTVKTRAARARAQLRAGLA